MPERPPPESLQRAGPAPAIPAPAVAAVSAANVPQGRKITLPRLATIAAVAAVLALGREVFLPLAIAILLTFALSPLVSWFRRRGVPQTASVLVVVFLAFSAIGLFSLVVAGQLTSLASRMPEFQANIVFKLEGLKSSGEDRGVVARLAGLISTINSEISQALPREPAAAGAQDSTAPQAGATQQGESPLRVELVERQSPLDTLVSLVMPLISPVATMGLVIVVVIFMLLEREELRDRFIRLTGAHDLHRTTQVLEDAGSRVGSYLLVQLLVNVIYALPIGIGLWLIGVPNALLWGLLTLVLRFVPYIGSILSAAFPLFLAFAVSPDWEILLWTASLFIVVELITSNAIEPWLYGSRTGVSPLAIIVSAIFWTWIWGPLGLVLSTPLTVCLVVLGRHIPQFELFDILFGDEPVLAPEARLYQRWLAGDVTEARSRAEEALEDQFLADYYQQTGLPALMLAYADWSRGVLSDSQESRVASAATEMVHDLEPEIAEELAEAASDPEAPPLAGAGRRVLCIGGRSALDDVAARMLAQSLAAEGAAAEARPRSDLSPTRLEALDLPARDTLVICFLEPSPPRGALLHIRRLKQAMPHLRLGVVIWQMPGPAGQDAGLFNPPAPADPARLAEALDIGADFAVTALEPALGAALSDAPPRPVPERAARAARPKARRRQTVAKAASPAS